MCRMLLALPAAMTVACAAGISPNASVTYIAPNGVTLNRLAILPVAAAEELQGFRGVTEDSLFANATRLRPEVQVTSADETLAILEAKGHAKAYAEMVVTYEQTGLLDKEVLRRLASALDVDHLLRVHLSYSEGSSYNVFLGHRDNQLVQLAAQLWDAELGEVVWRSSGGAKVSALEFEANRKFVEILAVACRDVVGKLPAGTFNGN
ncbi:MAG: hypothetical protein GTN62_07640 [Gemmatimonadales bacterium]|nr:hypothetical protein [Gemmatimonadales bacterium]NIN11363.1 hypothetical protein [Gemmatimonadales bacterium]NIN49973.1 hypothetical protein [Gemmatimonadales bacterium]NIP07437.1 hypothetical protein [Gemmatimonadales bacterium]NIR00504.1 hypothetical protein [Gemmatimonadales bacterium]